jgi:hypothetical protein
VVGGRDVGGLVATRQAGFFYAHDARESGDDASFEWADGAITVRAPDQVTLGRMIQIAELLDAVVQGDDGEKYTVTDEGEIIAS